MSSLVKFIFPPCLWAFPKSISLYFISEWSHSPHTKHPSLKDLSFLGKPMSCLQCVCSVDGWKVYIDEPQQVCDTANSGMCMALVLCLFFIWHMAVQSLTLIS